MTKKKQQIVCRTCGLVFNSYPSDNRKYCSRRCYGKSKSESMRLNNPMRIPEIAQKNGLNRKGKLSPLKGKKVPHKKGRIISPETRRKIGLANSKPDKPWSEMSYREQHFWLRNNYGIPDRCEINPSHNGARFEWMNLSREYKQDRNDWMMVCSSCHRLYDGINRGGRGINNPLTLNGLRILRGTEEYQEKK